VEIDRDDAAIERRSPIDTPEEAVRRFKVPPFCPQRTTGTAGVAPVYEEVDICAPKGRFVPEKAVLQGRALQQEERDAERGEPSGQRLDLGAAPQCCSECDKLGPGGDRLDLGRGRRQGWRIAPVACHGQDPRSIRAVSDTLVPDPNVVARNLQGTVVLVHLETNRVLTLNGTGSRVWEFLVAGRTVQEVEDELVRRYEVDAPTAHRELVALIDALRREQLIKGPDEREDHM
jgi:hypothetical protein